MANTSTRGSLGRKTGWRSGNLIARNVTVLDDLKLQGDIVLQPVTQGRLATPTTFTIRDQDGDPLLHVDASGNLRIKGKVIKLTGTETES